MYGLVFRCRTTVKMEATVDSSANNADSNSPTKEKTKCELPSNLQKICLVCGDKALGYNFNAISCESCKAFFRRNALASKEFKCPFTNSCEITVITRRFCQKCRLEKCLAIGMVKEYIMSEEDKAEKRKKIEENRAKKRTYKDNSDETVSSSKNVKREDENSLPSTNKTQAIPDVSYVQYDELNSTTCSPVSTVESPLSNEVEVPIQSPPIYNHYVPVTNELYPQPYHSYQQKKFISLRPLDEKTVQYVPRIVDSYEIPPGMEAMYDCHTQRSQSSIR